MEMTNEIYTEKNRFISNHWKTIFEYFMSVYLLYCK